jgi:single-strand DNA-binding protein
MAGLCKATIIGNLGGDPEMRYTAAGRPFTTFSVACNRSYTTSEGERREQTEWFRVVAGGRLAEICSQYLSKGRQVYVEGRLSTRTFEGSDGQKRFSVEISATEVQMIGPRQQSDMQDGHAMEPEDAGDLDSIPF